MAGIARGRSRVGGENPKHWGRDRVTSPNAEVDKGGTVNPPSVHTQSDAHTLPVWITAELIDETRAVWQPKYNQPLTDSEVIEILLNVASLLDAIGESNDFAVFGTSESF